MGSHLQTAAKYIRRTPYQAIAALLIMGLTFFVATILAVLAFASSNALYHIETSPKIIGYLESDASPEQISALQRRLEADSRVKEVKYISKEDAVEIFKKLTTDDPLLGEFVSTNVLPANLEFSLADLNYAEEFISELEREEIITRVDFTASLGDPEVRKEVITRLRNITNYIRIGGGVLVASLLASSLLTLLIILIMRVVSRREEIEILKLLGATPGFIRAPFVLEGLFYATTGAFLGWLIAALIVLYSTPTLTAFFGEIPSLPLSLSGLLFLLGIILGAELGLALVLGTLGSMFAVRRYLKI